MKNLINVFVRQPFTQSNIDDQRVLQSLMNVLKKMKEEFPLNFLTSLEAQSSDSFKKSFETYNGQEFTPQNFRDHRLKCIDKTDAFIVLRTGLSESGAFEVAYNIFSGRKAPLFFAIWEKTPIQTTLIREMEDICSVDYVTL